MSVDSVLIQHGCAHEIWRGVAKADLPPMHPDLLAQVVEVDAGTVQDGDVWDGESFSTPQQEPADLHAYAAQLRWQRETSGIDVNGLHVPTDARTQQVIAAAYTLAKDDDSYSIADWKIASGEYVSLDAATIIAIAEAVRSHVQACFALNRQVDEKISSGEITTVEQVAAAFA